MSNTGLQAVSLEQIVPLERVVEAAAPEELYWPECEIESSFREMIFLGRFDFTQAKYV